MTAKVIRTLNDLAQLPELELLACCSSLRTAIDQARREHATSLREGLIPISTPFTFSSFEWRPRGTHRFYLPARLAPDTPIEDLALRASARAALKALHILCVEDLSEASESELLRERAIGSRTVARLREVLERAGLDFLPDPMIDEQVLDEPLSGCDPDNGDAERALPAPATMSVQRLLR